VRSRIKTWEIVFFVETLVISIVEIGK
jgi:hypothetical protein